MSAPSDPSGLLWGHQLKREHGFLLDRMKKVEAEHDSNAARLKIAEAAAESMQNKVIRAIDEVDEERKKWIDSAEVRLKELKEDMEKVKKIQPRLAALETEVQQAAPNHQSALKKIETVEELARKEACSPKKLVKKNDPSDVRVLALRLDAMEMRMQARIKDLEESFQVYRVRNNNLESGLDSGLVARDRPLPSTEASTEILPSRQTYVPALASPPYRVMKKRDRGAVREDSPSFNAQLRKSVKTTRAIQQEIRPSQHEAQLPSTQIEAQSPTSTPDLNAPYYQVKPLVTYPSKKSKADPSFEPRQTRSQARAQNDQTRNLTKQSQISTVVANMGTQKSRNLLGAACAQCRTSRVKCDRGKPACGRCCKQGKECTYQKYQARTLKKIDSNPQANGAVASHAMPRSASVQLSPSTGLPSPTKPLPSAQLSPVKSSPRKQLLVANTSVRTKASRDSNKPNSSRREIAQLEDTQAFMGARPAG